MNTLHEVDVHALLTDLRDTLRQDGYDLRVLATSPHVSLAIDAGPDACEDCLVGKELMTRHVVAALSELDPRIAPDDIRLRYPADHA